jgi:unsaturated chondroitin disaccharide hydrolase
MIQSQSDCVIRIKHAEAMRRRVQVFTALAGACVVILASPAFCDEAAFKLQIDQTLAFATQQALSSVDTIADPTRFPRYVDPGVGVWVTKPASNWVSGFFPGMLWLLYRHGEDPDLLVAAEAWTGEIAGQATRTDTHDLGFMIGIPFGLGFEITGDPSYENTFLIGAASLASRYDADVGAIRSWDFGSWEYPVVIDNMMNLEFLFEAARLTTDPVASAQWESIASSHAIVSGTEHLRPDGSSYHVVDFDGQTGSVLSRETYQGLSDSSTWSRGQAWGIYGFAVSYRENGNPVHLTTSMAFADYYIDHLPTDQIPYWDFDAPNIPNEPRDSSAAAIAASGLLRLSTLVADPMDRERYLAAAKSTLGSLMSEEYLSDGVESPALLLHGTSSYPHGNQIDFGQIWGDYYFVEALLLYQEMTTTAVPTMGTSVLLPGLLIAACWLATRRAVIQPAAK